VCGIAGFWDPRGSPGIAELRHIGQRMADVLQHRGPDDAGTFEDPRAGLVLAFRRLSILDLSAAGHQPMTSVCGRYVIVYNGEIYNHKELRRELGTHLAFRGHSDTEVILGGFTRWGIRTTVERLNGMFGFAVWDLETQTLTLGRDRFGEKPLYYGRAGGRFLFGSELKPLRSVEGFSAPLDRDALALFMRHGCIPSPHTVYEGVHKLRPGCLLEVRDGLPGDPIPYWSAVEQAEIGVRSKLASSERELEEELHALLYEAVGMRMEADVPLGAFLSGGIDSSLVVALMQAQSASPVKTFSIGFSEADHDEAPFAKQVASHLGTEHTELYVTPADALSVVPLLPTVYDEPFADSSQVPTYLVSQLARRDVAVSLSGDGGDELFGGYSRYALLTDVWHRLQRIPLPVRRAGASVLAGVPTRQWDALFRAARPILPARARVSRPGEKLHKLATGLSFDRPEDVYLQLMSQWRHPNQVVLGAVEPLTPLTNGACTPLIDPELRAMQLDAITYLPDDILVKVDRAAMAVSLETRVPLLDHRIYELAWRLPSDMRNRAGEGKYLLRKVLDRYVPRPMVDRPKMGFGVPIGDWLRGPLREWGEDLLSPATLRSQGLLDVDIVRSAWTDHVSERSDRKYELWSVLMLQAWLAQQDVLAPAS
jgi:asparagine synthase (glutamine-hydrolysing)